MTDQPLRNSQDPGKKMVFLEGASADEVSFGSLRADHSWNTFNFFFFFFLIHLSFHPFILSELNNID